MLLYLQEREERALLRMKKLDEREQLESEEKRKRIEEDDQFDYLGGYGASMRNGNFNKGSKTRSFRTGPSQAGGIGSMGTSTTKKTSKVGSSALSEVKGLKRRATIGGTKR